MNDGPPQTYFQKGFNLKKVVGPVLAALIPTLGGVLVGVIAGALALGAISLWQSITRKA